MVAESLRGIVSQQLIPAKDGKSRIVAYELLHFVPSVSKLIRDAKIFQIVSVIQMGRSKGMQLMDTSLLDLVREGQITREQALDRAVDPKTMAENFKNAGL
jgi:twitching motility protein PilT